ncbi:MAG: methyl-accepting chemotaxis protein [Pseudohongiellaceae bacterium]
MIADENNIIVKMNPSCMKLMRAAQQDIKEMLPHFDAQNLIGQCIDVFHKRPEHQQGMLAAMDSTTSTEITIGRRVLGAVVSPMFDEQRKRIGTVVEWSDVTAEKAREKAEADADAKEKLMLAEMARVKSALDSTTTNVMITNSENIIVYCNHSVMAMLREYHEQLRQELPNFDPDQVVGSSVDIFHKNPSHQQRMLADLHSTMRTVIQVAGLSFSLVINPVKNEEGQRVGTVLEWINLKQEILFEESVNAVIAKAIDGDLESRINIRNDFSDWIRNAAVNINALLDSFSSVMNDVNSTMGKLAQGQLTEKMTGDHKGQFGELQSNVNTSIEQLVSVVNDIAAASGSVQQASVEITNGNNDLSKRTEQQAASLEETSSAMEEITATVQQNAENSIQANTLARGARETAENGGTVVGQAVEAMQAISESSKKINDIIGVIDEIAFQTNLLALNAAVEAARAGDQGRGFAVVADEVRSLAGRSAKAAKEIKDLIKDSGVKVSEGSELVNRSGETLEEIVTAVKKVNDIVAEIATASDEQSTGLSEISRAIGEMDSMTQQNAALVEEAAAASESMSSQANNLEQLISFFNTGTDRSRLLSSPAPYASPRAAGINKATKVSSEARSASVQPVRQSRSAGSSEKPVPATRPAPSKAAEPASSFEDEGDEWEVF